MRLMNTHTGDGSLGGALDTLRDGGMMHCKPTCFFALGLLTCVQ
jgi:hypothetical protein